MVEKEPVGSPCATRMGRLWILVFVVVMIALAGIAARNMTAKRDM